MEGENCRGMRWDRECCNPYEETNRKMGGGGGQQRRIVANQFQDRLQKEEEYAHKSRG